MPVRDPGCHGIALLALLTANVVARYALASGGFRFAQELPERLFPWFIMAGVALAAQKGGHMAVETAAGQAGTGAGRACCCLSAMRIVVVSYAVLFWEAIGVAEIVSIERSPVLGLPSSHGYYALALGCVAASIVTTLAQRVRVALIGPEAMPNPEPGGDGT